MKLYKYRSISENTEKIITEKKVWLSCAERLNDPFECTIQEIAADWMTKEAKKDMEAHLSGFTMNLVSHLENNLSFYGLGTIEMKKILKTIRKKPTLIRKYKFFREFVKGKTGYYPTDIRETFEKFDEQLKNVGIFSMSKTCFSPLMWSHYADESRGIAIGFEFDDEINKESGKLLEVNYSDTFPSFDNKGFLVITSFYMDEMGRPYPEKKINIEDSTFRNAISTKSAHWNYEEEWRYVEEEEGLFDYPGRISEIVFGLTCSREDKLSYINLYEEYNEKKIKYYEIIKKKNTKSFEKIEFKNE